MDKIAVLIPCYNEEITIRKVVKDFKKALPEARIYVYDNNSTDNTVEEAKKAGAEIRYEHQQGKGNVIRRMFREVDAKVYIMVDGDDTYPAEAAPEMINKVLEEGCDMVVGDRLSSTYFTQNKRPFHNFGNTLVLKTVNFIFGSDIKDIMTGYRAFSYEFVKSFPVLSRGFEIETEMSIHAVDHRMQTGNTIVQYRDRPQGSSSKLNTFSDGIKVLFTIERFFRLYRPMLFYGLIALFLSLVSLFFLVPVIINFAKTGLVARFPTLITCGFAIMGAMLIFFTGLILQTIRHKDQQNHEILLHELHFRKTTC